MNQGKWKKPKSVLPERWEAYTSIGRVIEGTRFISFKVPLKENLCCKYEDESLMFTPQILLHLTHEQKIRLGLIVDLTFTKRYYDPQEFTNQCVDYKKIFVPGHIVPPTKIVLEFYTAVDRFLQDSRNDGKLIGVHCTHGVNRTGYLISRYLIEKMGFDPEKAIQAVGDARGYPIERKNYLEDLRQRSMNTCPDPEAEDQKENDLDSVEASPGDAALPQQQEHQPHNGREGGRGNWSEQPNFQGQDKYHHRSDVGNWRMPPGSNSDPYRQHGAENCDRNFSSNRGGYNSHRNDDRRGGYGGHYSGSNDREYRSGPYNGHSNRYDSGRNSYQGYRHRDSPRDTGWSYGRQRSYEGPGGGRGNRGQGRGQGRGHYNKGWQYNSQGDDYGSFGHRR